MSGDIVSQPIQHKGEKEVNTTNTKRRKIPPREIRIKAFHDAHELRKRGLSYSEIRNELYRRHGVWIGKSTIGRWLRGVSNPIKGIGIPSLEFLKPSEDLANVIGVVLGDGTTYEDGDNYVIRLGAKDKEFVEDFGRRLANVLGREPIRPWKVAGKYITEARSKTLYELLRKPVDLKRIKPHIEHCPKCTAAFLRGLFDSEASVNKTGYIYLYNTNYELLVYAQKLLWKYFGIESTGPWPIVQKGTTMRDPKTGKLFKKNKDCYYIYIRAKSLPEYHRHIGFTIRRKQKRLEEYLRRVVRNGKKRKKIPPRELRIKMYNDVPELRKRGLSYSEIRNELYRRHGVWIGKSTIGRWLRGVSNPIKGIGGSNRKTLTHPFFPSDTYQLTASMGSIIIFKSSKSLV